jgi:WD40 repeat protein
MSDPISADLLEASAGPRRDWWAWLLIILAILSIWGFVMLMDWMRDAGAQPDRIVAAEHTGEVAFASFDQKGGLLLTGTTGGEMLLTRVETAVAASRKKRSPEESPNTGRPLRWGGGEAAGEPGESGGDVVGAVGSPNGEALVTWDSTGRPTVWNLSRGGIAAESTTALRAALAAAPGGGARFEVTSASFAADGSRVALGSSDGRAALLDARTGELLLSWTAASEEDFHLARPAATRNARRGAHLETTDGATAEEDGEGSEASGETSAGSGAGTGAPLPRVIVHVALSPDATHLATWVAGGGVLTAWSLAGEAERSDRQPGDAPLARLDHGPFAKGISTAAWAPDGERLAIATRSLEVVVVDGAAEVATFAGHTTAVTVIAWSGDGEWIATRPAAKDPIIVWSAATGAVRGRFMTAGALPSSMSIALSDDGSLLTAAVRGLTPTEAILTVIRTTAKD